MSIRILIAVSALGLGLASAGTRPQAAGVEVQMILTSADHMNHQPAVLKSGDITIMDAAITDWLPLTGRDLELYFVIDDSANYNLGAKLEELRGFIRVQPDPVAIGVAYIHDGALRIAEKPTTDHELAARALRGPSGSGTCNPYSAISSLIANWPRRTARREMILVTAGGDDSVNAEAAIHDAERAGVVVYALYNPTSDYLSREWSKVDAGLVTLAGISYETGGEAYFVGHTPPVSIEPYLTDIAEHLGHQYLVTFEVMPQATGGWQTVFVVSANPDRELMKPEKIWVPGLAN